MKVVEQIIGHDGKI